MEENSIYYGGLFYFKGNDIIEEDKLLEYIGYDKKDNIIFQLFRNRLLNKLTLLNVIKDYRNISSPTTLDTLCYQFALRLKEKGLNACFLPTSK